MTEYSNIDASLRKLISSEIRRTGVTPRQFMKRLQNPPEGLTARTMTRWLSGEALQAEQAHVDYVLRYYAKLPDRLEPRALKTQAAMAEWVEITVAMASQLQRELTRTGLSAPQAAILTAMPPQMTGNRLNNWKQRKVKTASPDLWNAVMEALKAQPDCQTAQQVRPAKAPPVRRAVKEYIDWELVDALRAHKRRTRAGAQKLLVGWGKDRPEGLTTANINGWLKGRIRKADPALLRAVLERYAGLPDGVALQVRPPLRERAASARNAATQKLAKDTVTRIPITPEWVSAIKAHRFRTGIYSHVFIRDWADKPQGLTFAMLETWLSGKTRTADPAFLNAIMQRYEGMAGKQDRTDTSSAER